MKVAYVRVSTVEQNEARQIEGLQKHGIDRWYTEKVSGKNTHRPELQRMLSELQTGDTVYVHDFSRLSRSTKDLLDLVDNLVDRGITLVSNKEGFDTSTPSGRLMLTMIGAINEFERANLLERQAEGIAIAKENGVYGKPVDAVLLDKLRPMIASKAITKKEAALRLGVSRPTLDKLLKKSA